MKLRELFNDPSTWTQFSSAKDKDGNSVPSTDPNAVCWCLLGAIAKCYSLEVDKKVAYDLIRAHLTVPFVIDWNDDPARSFDEVKKLAETLDI